MASLKKREGGHQTTITFKFQNSMNSTLLYKFNPFFQNSKFRIAVNFLIEKSKQLLFSFIISITSEGVVGCQNLGKTKKLLTS